MGMTFKQKLTENRFVKTLEIAPPKGSDLSKVVNIAKKLRNYVDAFNITDNQRAMLRMSPLALSSIFIKNGMEPVMQMTCRDRNRLALKSDLLGAYALGIRNILALTGDSIKAGNHKDAKQVFDIDSVHLLKIISDMKNSDKGKTNIEFLAGAAINPNSDLLDGQIFKMKKKIDAGASFFQTQPVFSKKVFFNFINLLESEKIQTKILAGIFVLRSAKIAEFMNIKIPGITIPDNIIKKLKASSNPEKTGIEIAVKTINKIRDECEGIHIMAMGKYDSLPYLFKKI
ncbi:5,10-methylenetetrahydrofolate reductase [Candidatus Woesearchaeota archaeon]|nr:5,10-methylenetetrahydrofolate reductase [Candidatus Woesearchaeota archaeon]